MKKIMENNLPSRKRTHLGNYDYGKTGVYFVTICTHDRKRLLSKIVKYNDVSVCETSTRSLVGEGLAPPENSKQEQTIRLQDTLSSFSDNYKVSLTHIGKVVEEQLLDLEKRYANIKINSYVIMPDHIHILIYLRTQAGGASPSPTLNDIVCALKSLTTRKCKKQFGTANLFQRSYSDHIIRDKEDYDVRLKYIRENPIKWYYNNINNN